MGISTKVNPKIKAYCYKDGCGPVVETGFHLEKYLVCTKCKEEVTENLRDTIKSRIESNSTEPSGFQDDEYDGQLSFLLP